MTAVPAASLALVAVLVAGAVFGLVLRLLVPARRRALSSAPALPVEDRAPAGLGRLVPVGAQVEQEYRRGLVALEHWLISRRSG